MTRSDRALFALHRGDAADAYPDWPSPAAIISDGAYGIPNGETTGDTIVKPALTRWYRPHITAWSAAARPDTTLWIWNTEIGWAILHPELERQGWDYIQTIIWDKGRSGEVPWPGAKFPVVTEICVVYRLRPEEPLENRPAFVHDRRPDAYHLVNVWPHPLLKEAERFSGSLHTVTHPHQKPLELMNRIIAAATRPGDVIWEPFAGTATASVAAVKLGRRPFAAENNPRFADLAHERLQSTTPDS